MTLWFCLHRDRPGSLPLRMRQLEQHWSYMDAYADRLVARGPTFDVHDGDVVTGSVHVVDLADAAAARAFALDEPCWQAGAYRDVLVRRYRDALGATMWERLADVPPGPLFLLLGLGEGEEVDTVAPDGPDVVAWGSLVSDDGDAWLGTAALVRADDAAAARSLLTTARYAVVEAHPWEPGGRR